MPKVAYVVNCVVPHTPPSFIYNASPEDAQPQGLNVKSFITLLPRGFGAKLRPAQPYSWQPS